MRLILIRHAERTESLLLPDHDQPLTPKGERQARLLGEYFAQKLPPAQTLYCSPYKRALQTAQLLNEAAAQSFQLEIVPALRPEPEGSVEQILELVTAKAGQPYLILVAHKPELEQLGAYFSGQHITLKKAEAVCLLIHENNWLGQVEWNYLPKLK